MTDLETFKAMLGRAGVPHRVEDAGYGNTGVGIAASGEDIGKMRTEFIFAKDGTLIRIETWVSGKSLKL